ncbi:chitin-binding type-4 domain-containing protein [Trichonephila clavata]|uniref:Chitin-binding type-4 domain-containing protein n=1 Tax=Trichonephila clavata TaxID=2740835 RepID=A0A8X6J364_TRICU|nr:chitin-binding type-4 domain-containing protein [Trichonephila clavata]GFR07943.1 chitin-binding type-4 domain-containing protein [Trichonephila clavata]
MALLYSPIIVIVIFAHLSSHVSGHGRLIEPPSRSSMWRFGFKTKPNYNDNELFCGGYTVQWQRNGGKCGVCGDAWHLPTPRPNEAGGIYGRGIIVRNYKPGQVIKSTVDITANHRGFFEFKLCPHNNPSTVVTQDCLDKFPLELADGSGSKYYPSAGTGSFTVQLRLPHHLTCSQCVFQWSYTAGNNWGRCENGTSKVGCGPQETFRGCSDVAIGDVETNDIPTYAERPPEKPSISAIPPRRSTLRPRYRPRPRPTKISTPKPTISRRPYYNRRPTATRKPYSRRPRPTTRPTPFYHVPSRKYPTRRPTYVTRLSTYGPIYTPRPTPYRPLYAKNPLTKKPRPTYKAKVTPKKTTNLEMEGNGGKCRAVGVWKSISGIASWCDSNCARGYCPSSHCDCS